MPRALVTGGAGFVGRRFCKRLLDQGWEVVCVDPIVPRTGGILPSDGWPLYDPRDFDRFAFAGEDCREFFSRRPHEEFDLVVHLAAVVGGREMIERNPLAVADDLAIDAEFWQWAVTARPSKVIYFSSSAAYPIRFQREGSYRLLDEAMIRFDDDIGMPDMTYGWAKLTGEYLARLAYERHGLRSVVYRPFSGYGEDQDVSYPFPALCRRVAAHVGAQVIDVWGTGRQMRDFIHIEDCVTGVMQTMAAVDDGRAINLSTGRLTSFEDLVLMIARQLGFSPSVRGLTDRPEGVFARGGATEFQRELGFMARTALEDGVAGVLRFVASSGGIASH